MSRRRWIPEAEWRERRRLDRESPAEKLAHFRRGLAAGLPGTAEDLATLRVSPCTIEDHDTLKRESEAERLAAWRSRGPADRRVLDILSDVIDLGLDAPPELVVAAARLGMRRLVDERDLLCEEGGADDERALRLAVARLEIARPLASWDNSETRFV